MSRKRKKAEDEAPPIDSAVVAHVVWYTVLKLKNPKKHAGIGETRKAKRDRRVQVFITPDAGSIPKLVADAADKAEDYYLHEIFAIRPLTSAQVDNARELARFRRALKREKHEQEQPYFSEEYAPISKETQPF